MSESDEHFEEPALPDRDELLRDLARARFDRGINVTAVKTLLEELRRDDDGDEDTGFDALDGADNVTPLRRSAS